MSFVDKVCIPQRKKFAALEADGGAELSLWGRLMARCHYLICPTCRAYKRAMTETETALAALRDEEVK